VVLSAGAGRRAVAANVAALATAALSLALSSAGCSAAVASVPRERLAGDAASLPDRLGVAVAGAGLASAGYLVELRLEVLDPSRAAPLFAKGAEPRLVKEAGGSALGAPAQAWPPEKPEKGKTYRLFFDNTRRQVSAGDLVTASFGAIEARGIRVE